MFINHIDWTVIVATIGFGLIVIAGVIAMEWSKARKNHKAFVESALKWMDDNYAIQRKQYKATTNETCVKQEE